MIHPRRIIRGIKQLTSNTILRARYKNAHILDYLHPPRSTRSPGILKKAVLLSAARSGSSWLNTLLNSHPNAVFLPELLHEDPAAFLARIDFKKEYLIDIQNFRAAYPDKFVSQLLNLPVADDIRVCGFKVFCNQLLHFGLPRYLKKNAGIKIIRLERQNILEQAVSLQLAKETGVWNDGETPPIKIFIDPSWLEQYFKVQYRERKLKSQICRHSDSIALTYEELCLNTDEQLSKIVSFLDLPPAKLSSSIKKQKKDPIGEVVSNYDDLVRYFRRTKWNHIFRQSDSVF